MYLSRLRSTLSSTSELTTKVDSDLPRTRGTPTLAGPSLLPLSWRDTLPSLTEDTPLFPNRRPLTVPVGPLSLEEDSTTKLWKLSGGLDISLPPPTTPSPTETDTPATPATRTLSPSGSPESTELTEITASLLLSVPDLLLSAWDSTVSSLLTDMVYTITDHACRSKTMLSPPWDTPAATGS